MSDHLRVIDFGTVSALRSQTLWHAVAKGVDAGGPPTLSFVRSRDPFVSLGFHRSLDELDTVRCERSGWPVYRRMVGGGPVYLDERQLCFQLSVPAAALPTARHAALRQLLEPALDAFRVAGLEAELDPDLEVVVGDRKVCGHGAAQMGSAVVVVGNLIERFDHRAAVSVLRTPAPEDADEALRLMRRYVAWDGDGPVVDPAAFTEALGVAYGRALGLPLRSGVLCAGELRALRHLDRRFEDRKWVQGTPRKASPVWRLKVRAGVWMYSVSQGDTTVAASVVGGRIDRLRVADEGLADPGGLNSALTGSGLADAPAILERWGTPGRRIADALSLIGAHR